MREIAGKVPGKIKAGLWRDLANYDPLKGKEFDFDGVVERIARVYGVTPEEVENDVNVDELLPMWIECVNYVNTQVFAGLDRIPKNAEKGAQ